MRYYSVNLYGFFRRNKYFFFGCLAGFVISSIFMPVLEDCHHPTNEGASKPAIDDWDDPDESHQLQPFFKYNSQSLQLLQQHLQRWYTRVQGSAYEPVILNSSTIGDDAEDYSKQESLNSFDKDAILVRDKKLKFFRPRFHHTELKIKNDLLLCVLLRVERFLNQSLSSTQSSKLSLAKGAIDEYINYTTEVLFKDYDELDIYYFYPEIGIKEGETVALGNLLVSFNKGRNLESIPCENGQPKHAAMMRYLLHHRGVSEYTFVWMFTDQTLLSVENLLEHMQTMSASDHVLSTWSSQQTQSQQQSWNGFVWQNLFTDDALLDYGLLMSTSLLLQCQLNQSCLQSCFTRQEDSSGLQDTNVYQWHRGYHFNGGYTAVLSPEIFAELDTNQKLISKAITVYPVDWRSHAFSLIHMLIAQQGIQALNGELAQLESKIESLSIERPNPQKTSIRKSWPPGVFEYQKARTRYEVIRWTYWNASHVLMPNDIQVVRRLNPVEQAEVADLLTISQEWLREKDPNFNADALRLETAYRKFDAVRGLEYLVDLLSSTATGSERIRLQIVKPLNPIELMTGVSYVTENMRLTLVLPVRGEQEVPLAIRFLNHYANVCLKPNHQTMLIIALLYTRHLNVTDSIESMLEFEKKEFDRLRKVSLHIQTKFSANALKIVFMDLSPPDPSGGDTSTSLLARFPSELVYLDLIARSLNESSSEPFLLLHCRTNMLFSTDFLNRVRLNTIAGRQIFMPIPFVEYRLRTTISNSLFQQSLRQSSWSEKSGFPSIAELTNKAKSLYFDVRKENGYFDESNFEFVSFYLSDYLRARQLTERRIPIVRNHHSIVKYQDLYYNAKVDLKHLFSGEFYRQADQQNGETTPDHMRAVEPELRLFHSSILDACEHFESNVYSYESCNHRQLHGLGPKQKLASIVMEYLELRRRRSRL